MGDIAVNVELTAHAQASGAVDQRIRIHHGNIGLDESFDLDLATWKRLRSAAQGNSRSSFDLLIKAVPVTGGWPKPRLDAAWEAGVLTWADDSSQS